MSSLDLVRNSSSRRREFLQAALAGAAGVSMFSRLLRGQGGQPPQIKAVKLGGNLTEITGAGANAVMVTGPEGVVLVDGGLPDRSPGLLKLVAEESNGARVVALFNTHWHLDHTGSNEALGKAGAKIIAHRNTKKWLSSKVFVEAQNRTYEPRPPEALPSEVFDTTGKMMFGAEEIRYGHLPPAHTDGDMYVFFPAENLLMVSDVMAVGRYPIMDYSTGGWIGGMIDACGELLKIAGPSTRILPGAGPMQTRDDLQAQLDMLVKVRAAVEPMVKSGKSLAEVEAAAPTREFDAKWGKPDLFLSMVVKGLQQH